jgi:hypothetical protein
MSVAVMALVMEPRCQRSEMVAGVESLRLRTPVTPAAVRPEVVTMPPARAGTLRAARMGSRRALMSVSAEVVALATAGRLAARRGSNRRRVMGGGRRGKRGAAMAERT